jgi:hypothetical protein
MGEQMALMPIPTDAECVLLARLSDARAEVAVLRVQLAASWEREKAMDATNRDLRRELLEAHDIAGRAEGAASPKFAPDYDQTASVERGTLAPKPTWLMRAGSEMTVNWITGFVSDRRKVGL